MDFIQGEKIWGMSDISDRDKSRFELTDLIRFKGCWYCGFHEGYIHYNHPRGRARIIRSADGVKWESAKLLEWDGADVREPKFSVTSEGNLLINTSLAFVSKVPRDDGRFHNYEIFDKPNVSGGKYGHHYQLDKPGCPENDLEENVARQSVTLLSSDGTNWSSAYACETGVNTWRWEVSWYNGMGYSVGYGGKDINGTLYRTRDGKSWRVLKNEFFPDKCGNETSIAFGADNTAYCILRSGRIRSREAIKDSTVIKQSDGHVIDNGTANKIHGEHVPILGIGNAPYYNEWNWKNLTVDWNADGNLRPSDEVLRASLGGPKLLRLSDGRLILAGRILGPGRNDGYITLFLVDTGNAILTKFAEINGTSYAGVAEHDGFLWVTYAKQDMPEFMAIFMAKVEIPK